MSEVTIYDVYWEGPYKLDEIIDGKNGVTHERYCLYQVYGDHPCYGRDVLLYIGKTNQSIPVRFKQHYERFYSQAEEVKIFVASCRQFDNWTKRNNIITYDKIHGDILSDIESLLIHAHQPAYNSVDIYAPKFNKTFRVFNTGRRKSLLPETSTEYWVESNICE